MLVEHTIPRLNERTVKALKEALFDGCLAYVGEYDVGSTNAQCFADIYMPEDVAKELRDKLNIGEVMNELQDLKQQVNELLAKIELLENKPGRWEPKGGDWFIDITGSVVEGCTMNTTRTFGLERETEEQAKRAVDKMREFNRLLAYVDEHAPDYEFKQYHFNHYIGYGDGGYHHFNDPYYKGVGIVYMPEDVAIELCFKLNSGEVIL